MDQQIITYAIGIVVVFVLGLSYMRHKQQEGDDDAQSTPSIKSTMAEAREYFGVSAKHEEDSIVRALDLTPMKMLSGVFTPAAGKKKPVQDEEKEKE